MVKIWLRVVVWRGVKMLMSREKIVMINTNGKKNVGDLNWVWVAARSYFVNLKMASASK